MNAIRGDSIPNQTSSPAAAATLLDYQTIGPPLIFALQSPSPLLLASWSLRCQETGTIFALESHLEYTAGYPDGARPPEGMEGWNHWPAHGTARAALRCSLTAREEVEGMVLLEEDNN
jgi:hypothetical protein